MTSPSATIRNSGPTQRSSQSENCKDNTDGSAKLPKRKAPPGRKEPENSLVRSEDNLAHELHVEGFARAKARRAIEVADGVTHRAISVYRSGTRSQVLAVEEVEHF